MILGGQYLLTLFFGLFHAVDDTQEIFAMLARGVDHFEEGEPEGVLLFGHRLCHLLRSMMLVCVWGLRAITLILESHVVVQDVVRVASDNTLEILLI